MGKIGKLILRAESLKTANAFVQRYHRHHKAVQGHKFSLGAYLGDACVGVAICGRPVSRHLDDGSTIEVTRLCVIDELHNGCSFLYGACAKAAKALGYARIITYILDSEPGISLRAVGWIDDGVAGGGQWYHKGSQTLEFDIPGIDKYPTCEKRRYHKDLVEVRRG